MQIFASLSGGVKQMFQMFFLFFIIYIVPPLISVILYERLRGYKLSNKKRIALYLIFAFFITLAGVVTLWVLGWGYQVWIPSTEGVMTGLTYILAYAAVALGTAIVLPHAICLLRSRAAAEDEESCKVTDTVNTSEPEDSDK